MRSHSFLSILALCLALGLAVVWTAPLDARQASPATTCIENVTVSLLGHGLPDSASGQELMLLRVNIAPGGGFGSHSHPGALTLSIEAGTLVYGVIEGEAHVYRAAVDGTPSPTELLIAGQETTLNPGDWVFEQGIIHSARNDGEEPTVVLVAGLMRAGEPFTQCHDTHATPDA